MQLTGGLFVAFYPVAALVYPPAYPFQMPFYVENALWYSALEIEVVTSYDAWSASASVRINGVEIGKLPPRSYSQTGGALAPVSLHFPNGMLTTMGPLGYTGTNTLEIVPASFTDYVIVGNWRLHYWQRLS